MDLISLIFGALGDVITEAIGWFGDLFDGVAALFYTPAVAETPASLTLLGTLVLIGVGVGAFYFVLRWIISLFQIRTKG